MLKNNLKKKRERKSLNLKYKKISHADRIKIIYMRMVHNISVMQIEAELGIKYNSIRNILIAYERNGRTNKKKYTKVVDAPAIKAPEDSASPLKRPTDQDIDSSKTSSPSMMQPPTSLESELPISTSRAQHCSLQLYICQGSSNMLSSN